MASVKERPRRRRSRPDDAEGPEEQPAGARASRLFKGAVAAVGFVSSVAGLVFLFLPQLQPKDDPPPSPPAEQFARLSGVVLDPDTTHRQYLDRTDQPKLGFTAEQLARRGAFVQFQVELVGYRGKRIPLQRELVDARTGDELGQLRAVSITPPADRVASPWHDWVPLRRGAGSYVVVVKLLDETGVRALDCIQSPAFGGLAGRAQGKSLALCAAD